MSSHPLIERSSSAHKLDGRHSSAGQSIHSMHSTPSLRANSVGPETSYGIQASGSPFEAGRNQPGMALLGPVPSIVRCWLTETFSHDTLIYAAVCTGSYESSINLRLARHLRVTKEAEMVGNKRRVQLLVYLAEAAVLSSPRSGVPAMTVDFVIVDHDRRADGKQIEVFLGSDALRAHNADILFSQNVMTMIGDDDKKLSVPLVRPEDDSLFKSLFTASSGGNISRDPSTGRSSLKDKDGNSRSRSISFQTTANGTETQDGTTSRQEDTDGTTATNELASPYTFPDCQTLPSNNQTKDELASSIPSQDNDATPRAAYNHPVAAAAVHQADEHSGDDQPKRNVTTTGINAEDSFPQNTTPIHRNARSSHSNGQGNSIWGPWRRESGVNSSENGGGRSGNSTTTTGNGGYQRPGRSRGTKVLRPSKSSISSSTRSYSVSQMASSVAGTSGVDAHASNNNHPRGGGHRSGGGIAVNAGNDNGLVGINNYGAGSSSGGGAGRMMTNERDARRSMSSDFKPGMTSSITTATKDTPGKDRWSKDKENDRSMDSTSEMPGAGVGSGGGGNSGNHHGHGPSRSRSTSANPVGGASAFPWLNGGGGGSAGGVGGGGRNQH